MRIYKEKRIFQKYTNFFLDFRCTFFHKRTFLVWTYFSEVVRIFEFLVPFSFDFFYVCIFLKMYIILKCVHLFPYAYFFSCTCFVFLFLFIYLFIYNISIQLFCLLLWYMQHAGTQLRDVRIVYRWCPTIESAKKIISIIVLNISLIFFNLPKKYNSLSSKGPCWATASTAARSTTSSISAS